MPCLPSVAGGLLAPPTPCSNTFYGWWISTLRVMSGSVDEAGVQNTPAIPLRDWILLGRIFVRTSLKKWQKHVFWFFQLFRNLSFLLRCEAFRKLHLNTIISHLQSTLLLFAICSWSHTVFAVVPLWWLLDLLRWVFFVAVVTEGRVSVIETPGPFRRLPLMPRDITGELHSDSLSLGDKSMVHDLVDVRKYEEHASGFICQFKCCFQQKALKDAQPSSAMTLRFGSHQQGKLDLMTYIASHVSCPPVLTSSLLQPSFLIVQSMI